MKKLFFILVCCGIWSAVSGCSEDGMVCDDETYVRSCYDTQTVLLCSNGEEARWKCSNGFSCVQSEDIGADCIED